MEEFARSHGETVGNLVRKAVEEKYLGPSLAQRKAAMRRLLRMPETDLGTWEEAKAAITRDTVKRLEAP